MENVVLLSGDKFNVNIIDFVEDQIPVWIFGAIQIYSAYISKHI